MRIWGSSFRISRGLIKSTILLKHFKVVYMNPFIKDKMIHSNHKLNNRYMEDLL